MVIDINNFILILPYHEVNASSAIFVSTNLKWDLAESSSLDCPQIWFEEKFEAFHFSLIGFLREHKSLGQNFQNTFCQHLLVSENSHFRFVCWEWNWLWFLWLWLWFEQSWTHVEAIVLPIQTDRSLQGDQLEIKHLNRTYKNDTGWSNKTLNCNISLTESKN